MSTDTDGETETGGQWLEGSVFGRLLGDSTTSESVRRGSSLVRALHAVPQWVRGSWLYRWLTKEPEPSVIVIDLRETYTVGPFIRLLDAVIDGAAPYWEESTPKQALDAIVDFGERVAETRVGQLVVAALAPPEPPAERREGGPARSAPETQTATAEANDAGSTSSDSESDETGSTGSDSESSRD